MPTIARAAVNFESLCDKRFRSSVGPLTLTRSMRSAVRHAVFPRSLQPPHARLSSPAGMRVSASRREVDHVGFAIDLNRSPKPHPFPRPTWCSTVWGLPSRPRRCAVGRCPSLDRSPHTAQPRPLRGKEHNRAQHTCCLRPSAAFSFFVFQEAIYGLLRHAQLFGNPCRPASG